MKKETIKLLLAPADREKLDGVLDALQRRGLRVTEGQPGKKDFVLAVLSEHFYGDKALCEQLLGLIGAGADDILPLQLDEAPIPDDIKNALYARNIIPAAGRDEGLIAERIESALPKKKNLLPLFLTLGAVALAAIAGLLIWRASRPGEEPVPVIAEPTIAPLVLPEGLTEADLAQVVDMIIVSDRIMFLTRDDLQQYKEDTGTIFEPDYAYMQLAFIGESGPDGEENYFYDHDGVTLDMARYDDLQFLALLPNLRSLTLVLVDAPEGAVPDLSGANKLEVAVIMSCELESLDWLAGAPIQRIHINDTPVMDFSPLTNCDKLTEVNIDMGGVDTAADFSGFAPPSLDILRLQRVNQGNGPDLSGLSRCAALRELELEDDRIRDLDFLSDASGLESLMLRNLGELRDISAMRSMTGLNSFGLDNCPNLRDIAGLSGAVNLKGVSIVSEVINDFSPLAACTKLRECRIDAPGLHDASFLAGNKSLLEMHLFFDYMDDVDFMATLNSTSGLSVSLLGRVGDYAGLAGISRYRYLSLDNNGENIRALPFLQNVLELQGLSLGHMTNEDWALLPKVDQNFWIRDSMLTDLTGFPAMRLSDSLTIENCPRLRSLSGIEALSSLQDGRLSITVRNCPLLTDVSALKGASLDDLEITDSVLVPSLDGLRVKSLRLVSVAELEDLSCLEGLRITDGFDLDLSNLPKLRDLSVLWNFHGKRLYVPPQVSEEGNALIEAGNFEMLGIVYGGGGFEHISLNIEVNSLEELESLPDALLRHVERLMVAGDLASSQFWTYSIINRWNNDGSVTPILQNNETGEETEIPFGQVADLHLISRLTGLKMLCLVNQPLESLDGIQSLTSLEHLELRFCPNLSDMSAAFTLQSLHEINFGFCPVHSLQGIQNLNGLNCLSMERTQVSDLSPLADTDFETAYREAGGLDLQLSDIPCEDYSPLSSIRVLRSLSIDGRYSESWVPALKDAEIHRIIFFHSPMNSEDFAAFVAAHPELQALHMPWNEGITDLSPVLSLPELERLDVSWTMEAAVASLDGKEYRFEFIVEEP